MTLFPDKDIDELYSDLKLKSDSLIDNVVSFIEIKTTTSCTEQEQEKIAQELYSFLLDESTIGKYTPYISSFIMNSTDNYAINEINKEH